MVNSLKKIINRSLNKFNYKIEKIKSESVSSDVENPNYDPAKILLNIGSGDWSLKGWTNLDYPSEWYEEDQKKHNIVFYDIRNDNIPFADNSVDAIYCSHVIEHIENIHIERMFNECYRVLKKGGCFRIACPDAEFLYQATQGENDYWNWRKPWFSSAKFYNQNITPRRVDYLVREIATPKLLYYTNSINLKDYLEEYQNMEMDAFFEYLTKDLVFRNDYPGDHINYWTFGKAEKLLSVAGFKYIIRSKRNSSVCLDMQFAPMFDTTNPIVSLYVDAVK